MLVLTHLTDILVSDTADLLDVGGALGDTLEGVTGKDELILDIGGGSDVDVGLGSDAADVLLAEEVAEKITMLALVPSKGSLLTMNCAIQIGEPLVRVSQGSIPDLNHSAASLGVGLDVDVDGEVSVDVTHLVLEAAGDTDHKVVDDGADGAEGSNTLAGTVVQLDRDHIGLGAAEGDGNVGEILDELAAGTLNSHDAGLNVDLHYRAKKKQNWLTDGLPFAKFNIFNEDSRGVWEVCESPVPHNNSSYFCCNVAGCWSCLYRARLHASWCGRISCLKKYIVCDRLRPSIAEKKKIAHHCPEWAAVPRSECTAS